MDRNIYRGARWRRSFAIGRDVPHVACLSPSSERDAATETPDSTAASRNETAARGYAGTVDGNASTAYGNEG